MIVAANYSLVGNPAASVIGVDGDGASYLLEPDGQFSTSTSPVNIVDVSYNTPAIRVVVKVLLGKYYCLLETVGT